VRAVAERKSVSRPTDRRQTQRMEYVFPGWASPGDQADLTPKLAASERLAELALGLCERDLPLRNGAVGPPQPGTRVMPLAVYEEFGRAVKTFRACVHLASIGYGQSAHMLAAVVVQSSLIVIWAIEQGESVDRRADLHSRYRRQVDIEERRRAGIWRSLPSDDYLTGQERVDAEANFGPDAMGLWTGHSSLAELIDDLAAAEDNAFTSDKLRGFKIMAEYAASLITGTGVANQSYRVVTQLPDGRPAMQVNIGPGAEGCADALHTATSAFLPAIDTVVTHYARDLAEQVRRSNALLWRAWKDPGVLAALVDSDPCPCDNPGTLWGECHKWTQDLGTTQFVPITDADLVNFTPYNPKDHQPLDVDRPNDKLDVPEGPLILTFTFKLPFTLGLEDIGYHDLILAESWADPDDIANFGKVPRVRIRLHNEPTDGTELWPVRAANALRSFYTSLDNPPAEEQFAPIPGGYEQWVTLETPSGLLASEDAEDGSYAFHRSLRALNTFLTGLDLAVSDIRISSVSTREIGPVVFCGALPRDKNWVRVLDLFMHPDSFPFPLKLESLDSIKGQLASTFEDLRGGRPFLVSTLWHGRALRASTYRGDNVDCIVSLQTATESMMYDLLRGLLVDIGKTSAQIASRVNADLPFRSLLVKVLPPLIGGDWSLSGNSPVAKYWQSVYLVRNRIIHAGYSPGNRETEEAKDAFLDVREFISSLLWRNNARFPRTLVAKVGVNGLGRRGWMSERMRQQCEAFQNETYPFYWPKDIAGR
jgi:hypothetical protein